MHSWLLDFQLPYSLGLVVEDGTAIHKLPVMFPHCSSTRLGIEESIIPLSGQLWEEERIVLVCLYLLC